MNYQHPSLITPVHMRTYLVFCADGQPRIAKWRNGMGAYNEPGAYCTVTVMKRTTRFDVVEGVLLVAELPIPTREQIEAACEASKRLATV